MALDTKYIEAFNIETVILDKDTGAPLTGGIVTFEVANQPGVLKDVYQITYTSGVYNYTPLPNPMTLSAIGTFVDALDNPVIPYFFPYDVAGNVQYYRVKVESAGLVPQFVRDPVPFVPSSGGTGAISSAYENEISNPQFAEVLFDTSTATYTYSFNAVTQEVVNIAPDWDIIVTSPGIGTVTVSQERPVGSQNIVTNPGTTLTIDSGGITALRLRQRIYGSPNLWGSGYLSGSFIAKNFTGGSVTLDMYYSQSDGTVINQQIVSATLPANGNYVAYPGTKLIDISDSTQNFPNAYIDIEFDIPLSVKVGISSVMVAMTGEVSVAEITYDQESQNKQIDHLFHYYQTGLNFKPISSYLVGWDFPLNPAQSGESIAAQAIGTNKSYYAWDQTILFQSANSGITVSRSATQRYLRLVANNTTQMAIIQYLSKAEAQNVLFSALPSIGLCASAQLETSAQQTMTISLWWTDNASLPTLSTNTSIVSSLDANGYPTVAAGWNEIKRGNPTGALGKAQFTSTPSLVSIFGFFGFEDALAYITGKYFAIVVGTSSVTAGEGIQFKSISSVPGTVPTIPAPKTQDEVLRECQYYYQKSFPLGVTAAAAVLGSPSFAAQTTVATATTLGPVIRFPVPLINTPQITTLNPVAAGSEIYNFTRSNSYTGTASSQVSTGGFITTGASLAGSAVGDVIGVNWVADARLGIV